MVGNKAQKGPLLFIGQATEGTLRPNITNHFIQATASILKYAEKTSNKVVKDHMPLLPFVEACWKTGSRAIHREENLGSLTQDLQNVEDCRTRASRPPQTH